MDYKKMCAVHAKDEFNVGTWAYPQNQCCYCCDKSNQAQDLAFQKV